MFRVGNFLKYVPLQLIFIEINQSLLSHAEIMADW